MVGDLMMLPVRIGVRATRLWLRAAEETAGLAVGATQRLIGSGTSRGSTSRGSNGSAHEWTAPAEEGGETAERADASGAPTRERPAPAARVPEPPAAPAPAPAPTPEPPPDPEPAHVSEEPTLVEELAEPGAEDGAGAEVHVEEPWEGYAQMNSKQIQARLSTATSAELAAVQLYEASHRRRQTILNSVERELRRVNGRGA